MSRLARTVGHKKQRIIRILNRAPYAGEMVESEVLYGLVKGSMSSYVKYNGKIYRITGGRSTTTNIAGDTVVEGVDVLSTDELDGFVLTSDGSDGATWEVPSGGGGGGGDGSGGIRDGGSRITGSGIADGGSRVA